MGSWFKGYRAVAAVFWAMAVVAVVIWARVLPFPVGWDLAVYKTALLSLRAGHDPYADGMAVQRVFHLHLAEHPHIEPPYSYVYSPLTLPLLRAIGRLPFWLSGTMYWAAETAGFLMMLWVGMQFVEDRERRLFTLLAPAVIFFPGLVQNINLFSGNIAFTIYGLVFATALAGWRTGRWRLFLLVVLAASCCKAPLLSLLVIPVFSSRKEWIGAGVTFAVGCVLFAVQPLFWPVAFRHYLESVELQFSFNRDYSASPAGLLAWALDPSVPYQLVTAAAYPVYASLIVWTLWRLSRRYLAGRLTLQQWAPVLLVGTILLNPRVMEYDTVPLALPMALIAWRFFGRRGPGLRQALGMVGFFAVINVAYALLGATPPDWKHVECVVLVAVFGMGVWDLWRGPKFGGPSPTAPG